MKCPPPPKLSGVAAKMLALYIEWHGIMSRHLPKTLRYSLGIRIDSLFSEILEGIALAQFSPHQDKPFLISRTIGKNDTLKFMLHALYELRGINEEAFISLSEKAGEIGRMLYGWKLNAEKKTAGTSTIRPGG